MPGRELARRFPSPPAAPDSVSELHSERHVMRVPSERNGSHLAASWRAGQMKCHSYVLGCPRPLRAPLAPSTLPRGRIVWPGRRLRERQFPGFGEGRASKLEC
eukprot:4738401-Pyramimonas_sp.AAC.1